MLLAIDIGNTSTKFGIFDGEHLISKISISTKGVSDGTDLRSLIDRNQSIEKAVLCSVVPEKEQAIKDALQHTFGIEILTITNDLDFGLKVKYQPLSTLGTDRLVNSFAAVEKYGEPCIVCSIGTATTIDMVNEYREHLGGVIAPGMKTMAKALRSNTAQLPEIEIEKPDKILGNSTVASIRSGIFYGHIATVEGLIAKIKKEFGEARVIATGGFASLIAENTKSIEIFDEDLLLDGLRIFQQRSSN